MEATVAEVQGWQRTRVMWVRVLEESTGESLEAWNTRIAREGFRDEQSLRAWLARQGVTGYSESLLVMERFGYPAYLSASAEQLVDDQYADRPQLRPIFDAIVDAASGLGEVIIQARKTYVSLVAPRRTSARIQPTRKTRVDLGLRLSGQQPGGRLQPSTIHESTNVQISFTLVPRRWSGFGAPMMRARSPSTGFLILYCFSTLLCANQALHAATAFGIPSRFDIQADLM